MVNKGHKRSIDRFLVLLSALSVFVASPAAYSSSCEAEVKVVDTSARGTRFSFVYKHGGTPIQVGAISVYSANALVCRVSGQRPDGTSKLYTGDWTYGDVPPGFTVEATCKPPERGRRYRISVIGSCSGSTSFQFETSSRR